MAMRDNNYEDETEDYNDDEFDTNEYELENDNEHNKDENWVRIPADKELKIHKKLIDRAYSRLPKDNKNTHEIDINDFIALLKNLSYSPIYNPPYSDMGKKLNETMGVYSYLLKNFKIIRNGKKEKIKTPKEAGDFILEKGKVNPSIVKLWLEEEILVNPNALKKGYPQFKDEIECLEKKIMKHIKDFFD